MSVGSTASRGLEAAKKRHSAEHSQNGTRNAVITKHYYLSATVSFCVRQCETDADDVAIMAARAPAAHTVGGETIS